MARYKTKKEQRERRHRRLRKKIAGTQECPRLSVCKTTKHFYAQLIDDVAGKSLASVSTLDPEMKKNGAKANVESAEKLGQVLAEKAKAASISKAVFDRGGFKYHGVIKAFADSVRKSGVEF